MKRFIFMCVCLFFSCKNDHDKNVNQFHKISEISKSQDSITTMFLGKAIDSNKIVTKTIKSFHGGCYLIYFFHNEVCDVCELDVFDELKKISKNENRDKIIVLVPLASLRDFKRYNKEYKLNLNTILAYKGQIFDFNFSLNKGVFFILDKGVIKNVFLPKKPIETDKFDRFYNDFMKMYSQIN